MTTLGAVVAAGAGARFGGPKALAESSAGQRWVDIAVGALRGAGIAEVVVVTGAWNGPVSDALVRFNPEWELGLSTSVSEALRCGLERRVDNLVLVLVDTPEITATDVVRVLQTPGDLVQALYQGVPGHPVKISHAHFEPLLSELTGDQGARSYLMGHGVVEIEMGFERLDQDFPE